MRGRGTASPGAFDKGNVSPTENVERTQKQPAPPMPFAAGSPADRVKGLLACAALFFFGLASALAIQASVVEGKLPYNTTAANFIVEVVKLVMMLLLWSKSSHEGDENRDKSPAFHGKNFKITARGWAYYSVPGFMYAVQNQLVFYAVANLQPAMFQLASKMKFVSTALLARIVLKKTLTMVQWIGIVLLMVGLLVSKSPLILGCGSHQKADLLPVPATGVLPSSYDSRFAVGMILVTTTSTISGASGIANEFLLKHHDEGVSVLLKNAQLYLWGVVFNGIGCCLEVINKGISDPLHGFGAWTWFIVFLRSCEGVSISFIMQYMDNIVKCFVSAALVYTTALSSYVLFGEQIDMIFLLGLLICSLALVLYFGPFNDVLRDHAMKVEREKVSGRGAIE
jgi:UDP-sugar transporter A1/2/3